MSLFRIHTKDCRIDWRLQVRADDVSGLGFKIRIIAGHEAPEAVWLQAGLATRGVVGAKLGLPTFAYSFLKSSAFWLIPFPRYEPSGELLLLRHENFTVQCQLIHPYR
jgi:hypothetical protein